MPTPALARGARVQLDGERVRFDLPWLDLKATVSVPKRPLGWIVVADDDPGGTPLQALERSDYATVRVARPRAGEWSDALAEAARRLARLPEARGLPIALAGAGEHGNAAALAATHALGPLAAALIRDRERPGPIVLVPTLELEGPGADPQAFLKAALAEPAPTLNHAARRRLQQGLRRGLAGEARGPARRHLRRALAVLASALAFTLGAGLLAAPAQATFTASYVTATGQLSLTDAGTSAGATLDCDTSVSTLPTNWEVNLDDGGGPDTLSGPGVGGRLNCHEVVSITVSAGGGADAVQLAPVVFSEFTNLIDGVTIDGGAGNDTLSAVNDRATTIAGGTNNDSITGSGVADSVAGNAGDDTIAAQGGSDTVDYSGSAGAVNANLGAGTATGEGTDSLSGTENAIGSASADTLTAVAGGSSLLGGSGGDSLVGAAGVDTLSAEVGDDTVDGAGGADTLDGGTDRDSLLGGTGTVTDTLDGGAGVDTLDGENGADSVRGGTEDDVLLGDDVSNDTLNGEAGNDTADYTGAAAAVDIDLNADSASGAGTDTLTLIEHAIGSAQADTIDGDGVANTLTGLAGADTINGNAGNDNIQGNGDADSINAGGSIDTADGGGGNDTVLASTGTDGLSESLIGGTNDDSLVGTSSPATYSAGDGADTVDAGDSDDSIVAGPGGDSVDAGYGDDTIVGDAGADSLLGGTTGITTDDDLIFGGTENDTIDGRFGDDTLGGEAGDDSMIGNIGADSIDGGLGSADTLTQGFVSDPVLTDSSLVIAGPVNDTLAQIERVSLSGSGLIDAAAWTGGPLTLSGSGGVDTIRGGLASDSIDGGGDVDRLEQTSNMDQTLTNTLLTGNGSDTLSGIFRVSLTGGAAGNALDASAWTGNGVTLDGQDGNDILSPPAGGANSDSLIGGAGTLDRVAVTRDSNLTLSDTLLSGGSDNDTLSGVERASLAGGGGANDLDASAFSGAVTLDGGDGGDTLAGAAGSDQLTGGNFSDRLEQTANANQTLTATQVTGDGTDSISGIETASLTGGAGANAIDASTFPSSSNSVTLAGLDGNDTLTGTVADDSLAGGADADRIVQSADAGQVLTDTQATGAGTDTLSAVEQASLSGGASANSLNASAFSGSVTLAGLGGDDFLLGTAGSDSLDGGTQTTADSTTQTVNANQTLTDTQLTGVGTDTIASLEVVTLNGGAGANDLDASGFSGRAEIHGAAGNDTLAGAAGSDDLFGEGDTDVIEQTSDAASQVLTNAQLTGDGTDDLFTIEQASLTGGGSPNLIDATAFTAGPTTLAGLAGTDQLDGSPQADSLDGGANADTVDGNASGDTLQPGAGADSVLGDAGTDRLSETADANITLANASLVVGAETDTLDGAIEVVSLTGGAGANAISAAGFTLGGVTLDGQGANDTLTPGGSAANSDSLVGAGGTDRVSESRDANLTLTDALLSGTDSDSLSGVEQASLTGGAGANDLDASAFGGAVTLNGGDGVDTIAGAAGSDSLLGGNLADRLEQTSDAASQVLTNTQLTGDGVDTLNAIEAPSLTGGASGNAIDATGFTLGGVTLAGQGGNDSLTGGSTDDLLDGGANTDRVSQTADADQTLTNALLVGQGQDTLTAIENASLTGGASANNLTATGFTAGAVTLDGQGGADSLLGSSSSDSLLGSGEDDTLQGATGSDILDGGTGNNTADFSDDPGGTGVVADLATGQVQNASTDTLASVQNMIGTSFADVLTGDGAANTLTGGGGADTITGGAGSDALLGNAGNDTHNSQDGGTADANDCGADTDVANVDAVDTTVACETVNLPQQAPPDDPPSDTPPGDTPPTPADTKAPRVEISGKAKQKSSKQIKVDLSCDEACSIEAGGTIKIPEPKSGGKLASKKQKFDLKGASAELTAGQSATVKLKLTGKAKRLLKKVIKKRTSTAKVSAGAVDAAGNSATSTTLKIKVKK